MDMGGGGGGGGAVEDEFSINTYNLEESKTGGLKRK